MPRLTTMSTKGQDAGRNSSRGKISPPRWAAWRTNIYVQDLGAMSLVLARNEADASGRNYLIIKDVANQLRNLGAPITDRLLNSWVDARKSLKRIIVKDPILLGRLKDLQVVGRRASAIKLASCAAICRAIVNVAILQPLCLAIEELKKAHPPLHATCAQVTPVQLKRAEVYEARLPAAKRLCTISSAAAEGARDEAEAEKDNQPVPNKTSQQEDHCYSQNPITKITNSSREHGTCDEPADAPNNIPIIKKAQQVIATDEQRQQQQQQPPTAAAAFAPSAANAPAAATPADAAPSISTPHQEPPVCKLAASDSICTKPVSPTPIPRTFPAAPAGHRFSRRPLISRCIPPVMSTKTFHQQAGPIALAGGPKTSPPPPRLLPPPPAAAASRYYPPLTLLLA
ncbi:hypothetical protein VaNZ11_012924 [Volvox africanus]|uniref:Uncharacterized protein n=1 Tax=Volvox africanus TaxID=51714 RepID=A0ABQ5RV72_9CHLO|nr:hypothetical protein VaNZ11_003146 [Volvox africanus]GLI68489.1 hypothetical protein VaNZ11_012924 [Volvox africanus]